MGEQMDFLDKFITTHRVPEKSRNHFASVEWTNNYLTSPHYVAIPTFSRVLKKSGEDYFFARTVSSPSTIPHLMSLQRRDFKTPNESPKGSLHPTVEHRTPFEAPEHPDTITLLELGQPGLDGHPSVIHGGVGCAILDETMGSCVMLHQRFHAGPRYSLFTAYLNVTYHAPVPTPGEVLVRCWITAREGRKWMCIGQIVSKEGAVMTEAEGMWVLLKQKEKL